MKRTSLRASSEEITKPAVPIQNKLVHMVNLIGMVQDSDKGIRNFSVRFQGMLKVCTVHLHGGGAGQLCRPGAVQEAVRGDRLIPQGDFRALDNQRSDQFHKR